MAGVNHWTRDQLLVALTLYSQIPPKKFDSTNPTITYYAERIGRTPAALAMKLSNFASLDPFYIRSGGKGLPNVSKADRLIWMEMSEDISSIDAECKEAIDKLEIPAMILNDSGILDFTGRERTTIIKARIDQQLFRKNVLAAYEYRCCLTELEEPALLVASHIRPWSEGVEHRLNPSNGLCLSSLYDKAFDRGLISFDEDLKMLLSPQIKKLTSSYAIDNFVKYEGKKIRLPICYPPDMSQLAYHRRTFELGEFSLV